MSVKPRLLLLYFVLALTTHHQLNDEELKTARISKDMIRVSVGIEHIDDIKWDSDQALKKANEPLEPLDEPRKELKLLR